MCFRLSTALLFLLLYLGFTTKAQTLLEGVVLDQVSNQLLDQIHIINISNKKETVSNAKGEFKISANLNDLLVFTSLGYTTDTVLVIGFKQLKHYLKADVNNLRTVRVNGTSNYKEKYAQTLNKANPILLKPGRGLLFYPSSYFSREGRQTRYFKRMIKKEQAELKIDQMFNPKTVTAILPLKQPELDAFLVLYRPSLAFVSRADADDFKFYLLDAFNKFKLLSTEKKVLPQLKIE
jgi:hypothetical protein